MSLEIQRPVEAMALLEALLRQSSEDLGSEARPIEFHFEDEVWNFDPGRTDSRCQRGANPEAPLALHCKPSFMGRLLLQPELYLAPGEELKLIGDPSVLAPLVRALGGEDAHSPSPRS